MSRGVKIFLVVLGVLLVFGFIIYAVFFGITKKQKFVKCVETCREMLTQESNKRHCESECEKITGYSADLVSQSTPATETGSQEQVNDSESNDITYYCEWSWPQKIINKDTKEVIEFCIPEKPYCNKADGSYEKVGCCEDYDEATETHVNCTLLKDIKH